jgi:hypothetical protein
MTCPACGEEASGRFCAGCGAALTAFQCPHCDTEVAAGSRFCQHCGKRTSRGANRGLPWIVAGASVTALAAVLLVRLTSAPAENRANASQAPDITTMSPRERADRLFNRVMAAVERGDTGEVKFFVPMAVQSYQLIGDLDPDARYHLGLIQFVNRDFAAAEAQADSIERIAPGHLLGKVLRIQLATIRHDTARRNKSYRDFLASYDREMGSGKPEYADHSRLLEHLRDEARAAVGKGKTPSS